MTQIIYDDGRCYTAFAGDDSVVVMSIARFGWVPRLRGAKYAFFYVERGLA